MIDRLRGFLTARRRRKADGRTAPADWHATVSKRTVVAAVMLGFWAVGIEARLVYLQTVDRADLVARAERQQMRTIKPAARRGDIIDRHGRVLATSVDADSVYAVPSEISDKKAAIDKLCGAFGDCTAKERQTLAERFAQQRAFTYVRRQISPEESRRVTDLGLDGIGFIKESRRYYPSKELAAHLLGYVGIDNTGLNGMEAAYDSQISGKPGTVLVHTDARRHAFSRVEVPPTPGSSLELTIDQFLQHIAERELHAGVVENKAAGGSVVILNPRTGEILAMANDPTFNPNTYQEFPEGARRNRAVQDLYEPGSTFKIVTASAAIQENVLPIDALIDTNPGSIRVGNSLIDEYEGHNYHVLSFEDVLVKSSNVGAVKIGFKIGTERLSRFVSLYGFGKRVSPDFPGENAGIVWRPEQWTDRALASVSMGYQIAVTPLQVVAAFSSVANGGNYVEPRVVRAIYRNNVRVAVTPKVVRQTVSSNTAAVLTSIMEQVVERGTAKAAQIPGYTVAGKTGTASKLIKGRYSAFENNVSFAGFVPSRDPAIAMIVMIDAPHAGPRSGGVVAAPIFKRIAEPALRYLGIAPTVNPPMPVLVARHDGAGQQVTTAAPVEEPPQDRVQELPGTLPDLRGMSARDAMRKLAKLGLSARLAGDGFVVDQDPGPGEPFEPGDVCRLVLGRALAARSTPASAQ